MKTDLREAMQCAAVWTVVAILAVAHNLGGF